VRGTSSASDAKHVPTPTASNELFPPVPRREPLGFRTGTPTPATHLYRFYAKNDPLATTASYRIKYRGDVVTASGAQRIARWLPDWLAENTKLRLGAPEIPAVAGRVGQTRLHYLLDHTDDPVIPAAVSARKQTSLVRPSPGAKGGFLQWTENWIFSAHHKAGVAFSWRAKAGQHLARPAREFLNSSSAGRCASALRPEEFQGNQYYLFRAGYMHDLLHLAAVFSGRKSTPSGAT